MLISIFPMLKIGKLSNIASYIYLQLYLKIISRGQKYGGFFFSTVQNFYWLFCVGSHDIQFWVDFKLESELLKARKKKTKIYSNLRNGSNYG